MLLNRVRLYGVCDANPNITPIMLTLCGVRDKQTGGDSLIDKCWKSFVGCVIFGVT